MRVILPFFIFINIILVLTGCTSVEQEVTKIKSGYVDNESTIEKDETVTKLENKETNSHKEELTEEEKLEKRISEVLNDMTLEEKIGQMFMLAFREDSEGNNIRYINNNIKNTINEYNIGGVILFSENIDNPIQTKTFIDDLQNASKMPLFIGVDEEGGRVSRIGSNPNMKATQIPNMQFIGLTGLWENAYHVGMILGKELKVLGFNVNFAPVADVFTNSENRVIGNRAFGNEAELVADMVSAEVIGIQEQGVSACIKHFPGHGDTYFDTHEGEVQVLHDYDRLNQVEWLPFKSGIRVGTDFIMVGHISTPNLTKDNLPATLSQTLIKQYLRDELGYEGIIITDSMEMKAISNYYSSSESAIMAVNAGVDVLLMPEDFKEAYNALLMEVISNSISEERINESIKRILRVKLRNNFKSLKNQEADIERVLGCDEHKIIIEKILSQIDY